MISGWVQTVTEHRGTIQYDSNSVGIFFFMVSSAATGYRLPSPYGIAVYEDKVYWVDRNLQSLFRASKYADNATDPEKLLANLETVRDVAIFAQSNQPMPNP